MRHITKLIKELNNVKGYKNIIENNEFSNILGVYKGLDYREFVILARQKNKNNIILFENDNLLLKYQIQDKFKPKEYNKGLIKLLEGNLSFEKDSENFNYNSLLIRGNVYKFYEPTIVCNNTGLFAHILSLEN